MLTVYGCLVNEHDLRLVLLAGLVCTLASFAAISLLHHVLRTQGPLRTIWLMGCRHRDRLRHLGNAFHRHACVHTGHTQRLRYRGSRCSRLPPAVTADSGSGMSDRHLARIRVRLSSRSAAPFWAAASRPCTTSGMAAFEVPGPHRMEPVAGRRFNHARHGVTLGALCAAVSFCARPSMTATRPSARCLLTLAICQPCISSAMGAVCDLSRFLAIKSYPLTITIEPTSQCLSRSAAATLVILVLSCVGAARSTFATAGSPEARGRTACTALANAAVEGLIVCDGNRQSFQRQ